MKSQQNLGGSWRRDADLKGQCTKADNVDTGMASSASATRLVTQPKATRLLPNLTASGPPVVRGGTAGGPQINLFYIFPSLLKITAGTIRSNLTL